MSQRQRVVLWFVPAFALGMVALSSSAITITMEYTDEGSPTPHPENPAWDPAGTILKAHFNAAKAIWERLLPGPGNFEFDFHWDDDIDDDPNDDKFTLGLATINAFDSFIEINPLANWFVDSTPLTDDEFSPVPASQTLYGQLTPAAQALNFSGTEGSPPPNALETGYYLSGNAGPIGAGGYSPANGFDLLTVILHEIGHLLGINGQVLGRYKYDFLPEHVDGLEDSYVVSDGGHLAGGVQSNVSVPGFLMCGSCALEGERRLPSATDVLAIAGVHGISDVRLDRVGSIRGGSWSNAISWIGGDVPNATQDAYISHGDLVLLDSGSTVRNLTLRGNSSVSVGNYSLEVLNTLDFANGDVLVGSSGSIAADIMIRGANDVATASGSIVRFNKYEGGSSTSASFMGSVSIGYGIPTQPAATLDPTTIIHWNIANKLAIGDQSRNANVIIDAGTKFTSSTGQIGSISVTGPGGSVTIDGNGSKWTVVGALDFYRGVLLVQNKGLLSSGPTTLGAFGGLAYATVNDAAWSINGDAFVGPAIPSGEIQGWLTVENDGGVSIDGNLVIRGTATRLSQVTVQTDGVLDVDGDISVGPFGVLTYRNSTFTFSGLLGAETIANLGGVVDSGAGGVTRYMDSAIADRNAAPGTVHFTNHPGSTTFARGGVTEFHNSSSAGSARFDNLRSVVSAYAGGTRFFDFATAGDGTFYNQPGPLSIYAYVEFNGDSTGGNGTFVNLPGILGQSVGGTILFKDRAKAGTGTYTSQGEGGSVVFYHNSSADHGVFETADNVGGNSYIYFYDNSSAGHGTFTIRRNVGLNFYGNSTAANGQFSVRGGNVSFSGNFSPVNFPSTTAGNAQMVAEGGTVFGVSGGNIVFSTYSTAGNSTITAEGGTVSGAGGGFIQFDYAGQAGNATLIANGGVNGAAGGTIIFRRAATGGNSRIIVNEGGVANFGGNIYDGGTAVGSIEGAGTFALNGSELTTGSLNSDTIVSGAIVDMLGTNPNGRLTKVGVGKLTLAGANTYSGVTTVNAGTVAITGSILGGAVVNNGGTLNGTGTIGGSVTVNSGGIFAPGTSPGTITIGGLQMHAGGRLQFELGTTRDHIVINGNGNVTLGGILDLSLLGNFEPELNQTFPLFEGAVGSIAGTFATVYAPVFDGRTVHVVYGPNSVMLQVGNPIAPVGDYNGDGAVDAADYVVLRKGLGTIYTEIDYNNWRAHFGEMTGSGPGTGINANVPEPSGLLPVVALAALICRTRRSASRWHA